jgi:hypothetical protein
VIQAEIDTIVDTTDMVNTQTVLEILAAAVQAAAEATIMETADTMNTQAALTILR